MDHSIMKKTLLVLAALQIAKCDPIHISEQGKKPVNVNPRNVDPVTATNNGDSGMNIPQNVLVILVAGPCKPELTADGFAATPLGVIPINLDQLILRNQLINALNQQYSQDYSALIADKGGDLLNRGLLNSGSLVGSIFGTGGVTSESGSNLYQGGILGGGLLGNGILGNLMSTGTGSSSGSLSGSASGSLSGSASGSGTGILGLLPIGTLNGLNLGSGTLLGLLNLTPGSTTNTNLLTNLLTNLAPSNLLTNLAPSNLLTNLAPSNLLSNLAQSNLLTNLAQSNLLTNLAPSNLLSGINLNILNKPTLTTLLSNLGLGSGIPITSTNTGGIAGILGSLGIGGGIPAGPAGGLAGVLANLGLTNTIGTTPVFGATTSGLFGLLNTILGGTTGRMAELRGNFRRYYAQNVDQEADIKEMPWLVTILVDGIPVADGVLISDQHVLTAADPLFKVESGNIVILRQEDRCSDKSNTLNMTVKEIIRNPLFDLSTKAHDLALLKLSNRVPVSLQLLPICLPALYTPYIVYEATVSSYDAEPLDAGPSCKPRQVVLPLQPSDTCAQSIKPATLVTEDKTCLGVQGAKEVMCGAAPGTAVQYRAGDGTFELIGIMTHSRVCGTSASTLFVRVHDHLPWILENIKESRLCIKI